MKKRELSRCIDETLQVVNGNNDYVSVFEEVDKKARRNIFADFIPMKGDSPAKIVTKLIVGFIYIMFLFSSYKVIDYFVQSYQAEMTQHDIRQIYTIASQHRDMLVPEKQDLEIGVKPEKPMVLTESAKKLLEVNDDTVGYIRLPNTQCEGAVVQGEDNDFYLSHNIYGEAKQCGTLFLDYRATINTRNDSPNLIIYGHNQKDGTMFGELDFFRWNDEYWKQNPVVYFNTNYEDNAYVIIASFVTNELPEHDNGNVFDYWNYIYFNNDFPFDVWKKEVLERTTFYTGYDFTENDEYITLSTCSTEWEPSRHVVIARKLHSDESADNIDMSGWKLNDNPKMPQIWYDYNGGGSWKAE